MANLFSALSLMIAALSLAISLALAIREFATRPIPMGWVETSYQNQKGVWVVLGYRLHVANVGRSHFIVDAVGVLTEKRDGVSGVIGEFTWMPNRPPVTNRTSPFSLAPGEVSTYLLPLEKRGDESLPFAAQIIRRNRWRFIPGQAHVKRKWLILAPRNAAESAKALRKAAKAKPEGKTSGE